MHVIKVIPTNRIRSHCARTTRGSGWVVGPTFRIKTWQPAYRIKRFYSKYFTHITGPGDWYEVAVLCRFNPASSLLPSDPCNSRAMSLINCIKGAITSGSLQADNELSWTISCLAQEATNLPYSCPSLFASHEWPSGTHSSSENLLQSFNCWLFNDEVSTAEYLEPNEMLKPVRTSTQIAAAFFKVLHRNSFGFTE